ncbi:MAG: hypothetical protein AAF363_04940 [Bacteroidota bacterium]
MEIPKKLYNYHTNKPFEFCLKCNRFLLDGKVDYLLEKAFRNHSEYNVEEVIFDYAICMDCAMDMTNDLSRESLASLQRYFSENVSMDRMNNLPQDPTQRMNHLMNTCLLKGTEKDDTPEYQLIARCRGNRILTDIAPPYMICSQAMEELNNVLSAKTIDEMNGFKDNFFGGPPELEDILKKPVILV